MNSRERVLTALSHREPDTVPIDFSGHRSSGIAAEAYAQLRDYLRLPRKPLRVYDPIQQLAIVDEDVLDIFGVDVIELGRGFALENEHWRDWMLPDGTRCKLPSWTVPEREETRWVIRSSKGNVIAQMPDGAIYFEQAYFPFYEEDDLDAIEDALGEVMWAAPELASPPGPLVEGEKGRELLRQGASRLRNSTERAIIGLFGGNLLEIGQFLYRNDNMFIKLAAEPKHMHLFLDKLTDIHLANLENYLADVGEHIDIIQFGDDLGMQTGPQLSPDMYREFFKPRHAKMWKRAKELADVKVMLHCCGGVRPLLPHLIEAGLDCINPVQITCNGMEPVALKRDFGDDIVFWGGGCDTRSVLPSAPSEEIKKHVRSQVDILNPGGGFVFQQVHNILADVPPQNICAMFQSIRGPFE